MKRDVKFGWHMPSFPVDGSGGPAFVEQIHRTMDRIEGRFDSVWVDDHMMPWAEWQPNDTPYMECVSTIAYFAAAYPGLKFGASMFCQSYRNPGLLAKTAANLQLLTGGRLIFGIGAGWMEEEYRAYNFDFPEPAVRIAQLEEAVVIARKLWTESPASFEGKYYRIDNAYCEPRPDPVPPVLIGGGGEQLTLRVVAKHADWWNLSGFNYDTYARKLEVLRRHCREVGRDYDEILKTWSPEGIMVAPTEAAARAAAEVSPYYNENAIVGTPEQVAERLQAFAELGVELFIVRLLDFPNTAGIDLFMQEVMPGLAPV